MFDFKIKNFKCFSENEFHFSRINILIGENNSGKSSLIKYFQCLKQSLFGTDSLNLTLNGPLIDLGNYKEVVNYNQPKKNLEFTYRFGSEYTAYFLYFVLPKKPKSHEVEINQKEIDGILGHLKVLPTQKLNLSYAITKDLDQKQTVGVSISHDALGMLEIMIDDNEEQEIKLGIKLNKCTIRFTDTGGKEFVIKEARYQKDSFRALIDRDVIQKYCEKNGDDSTFYKMAYLLISQNFLEMHLNKMHFINPILSIPSRYYIERDKNKDYSKISIDTLINYISSKSVSKTDYTKITNDLNGFLSFFGIADAIDVVRDDNFPVIQLKAKIGNLWSNITDVGYGVALQIPIIFQAYFSEKKQSGDTIFIEQPELHLYPRLQAKFIETLAKIGNKNTYVIETHSEHIVRKLQSMVKAKAYGIKKEDVTIHYFKRDKNKIIVTQHKIMENGYLEPEIPSGFYDASYLLSKELLG